MKFTFQPKPENETRFFVRISEFSFESYPVQINRSFRAVSVPKSSPGKWHCVCRSVMRPVAALNASRKKLMARRKFDCARRPAPVAISQL